jgi:hypothetical protein
MKTSTALIGGLAGASVLTLTHETLRRVKPKAPRMDLLGMQALYKVLRTIDWEAVNRRRLFTWTLVGDVIGNALYYSLAGAGSKSTVLKGGLLGLTAGMSAVLLPGVLGLNEKHSSRTLQTRLMTIGLYTFGGLVAAAVVKFLNKKQEKKHDEWERRLVTSSIV